MTSDAIHLHISLHSALRIKTDYREYTNDLLACKWIASATMNRHCCAKAFCRLMNIERIQLFIRSAEWVCCYEEAIHRYRHFICLLLHVWKRIKGNHVYHLRCCVNFSFVQHKPHIHVGLQIQPKDQRRSGNNTRVTPTLVHGIKIFSCTSEKTRCADMSNHKLTSIAHYARAARIRYTYVIDTKAIRDTHTNLHLFSRAPLHW